VASSSNLNKQRRSGDNLYVYQMAMGREDGEFEPRWTEKVYAFGHCQFSQHHSFSNGRERIYGDPPPWIKGVFKDEKDTRTISF